MPSASNLLTVTKHPDYRGSTFYFHCLEMPAALAPALRPQHFVRLRFSPPDYPKSAGPGQAG